MTTVVPAYGRKYKTEQEALRDWNAGKDFLIQDVSSMYDGKYISNRDGERVKIRFNNNQDFVFAEPSND